MQQRRWGNTSVSRRAFVRLSSLAAAAVVCGPRFFTGQDRVPQSRLAADTMRPEFHLMPPRGWMNDPNGPIYAHGRYHIFCQHNPQAAVWGNMSWAHMVSDDMMHWRQLPVAIEPMPNSIDAYGIFSGSCFLVGKRVYAIYTATELSDAEHATTHGKPNFREVQRLAWSDDPMLLHWTKAPQPIVSAPPAELHEVTGFRDPSIWHQEGFYYMTVGAGETGRGGCVLLYRSADLKRWTYLHKFAEGDWHGTIQDDKVASGEMWECPDFFALDGGYVLIYSTEGKVFWQSGRLDVAAMRFHPGKTGVLDLGTYYAPKTQLDAHGNRILWGWNPERRPEAETVAAGWAGTMSLPRVLHLDTDGTLRMDTLPALKGLRGTALKVSGSKSTRTVTLPRSNGELLARAASGSSAHCTVRDASDNREIASVQYDAATQRFLVGEQFLPLKADDPAEIHLFADGSILEFILGQRCGFTRRFYLPHAPDLIVEMDGAVEVQAWPVRPISSNRLTTLPAASTGVHANETRPKSSA